MNNQIKLLLIATLLTFAYAFGEEPCEVSIVGSGLSGTYTAYRLSTAKDSPVKPWNICLFERSNRIGGQLISVTNEEFPDTVIELGPSKFNTGKVPLFGNLVDYLTVPTECAYLLKDKSTVQAESNETTQSNETTPRSGKRAETSPFFQQQEQSGQTGQQQSGQQEQTGQQQSGQQEMTQPETQNQMTQPETQNQDTEIQSGQANFTGQEEPSAEEKCGKVIIEYFYLRDKVIYSNTTGSNQSGSSPSGSSDNSNLFSLGQSESLEDLPDIAQQTFLAVMGDVVTEDMLNELRDNEDEDARWEKVTGWIKDMKSVKFQDTPINQVSVGMVLSYMQNYSSEYLTAISELKANEYIRTLLGMNFEHFAVQFLRNRAAGTTGEDRVISKFNGMRTVVDLMVREMEDLGVQIYTNTKLNRFEVVDNFDGIFLEFSGMKRPIITQRLFVALNKKSLNLNELDTVLSDEASQVIGNRQNLNVKTGIVFYDDAWWLKWNHIGDIYTDGFIEKLSHHTVGDCVEGEKCPGYLRIESRGYSKEFLDLDIFNPIDMETVLSYYYSEEPKLNETEPKLNETEPKLNETESSPSGETTSPSNKRQVRESDRPVAEEKPEELKPEGQETEMKPDENLEGISDEEGLAKEIMKREQGFSKIILQLLHRSILKMHETLPGFNKDDIPDPKFGIFANWGGDPVLHFGSISTPGLIDLDTHIKAILEPIPGKNIHFINSEFSEMTPWDHGLDSSIVQSERVLHNILGMEKPEWIKSSVIYDSLVKIEMPESAQPMESGAQGNSTQEQVTQQEKPVQTTAVQEEATVEQGTTPSV